MMEEYFNLGLTAASGLLFAFYLYKHKKCSLPGKIPGPKPLNTIEGNFADIGKSGGFTRFLQDIHNEYGPIVCFWWGPQLMVSLASPELFKYQSRDFNRDPLLLEPFRTLLGHEAFVFANGEEGKIRHKTYRACFNAKNIKHYYGMLNKLADDLISQWRKLECSDHISIRKYLLYHSAKAGLQGIIGAYFEDDQKAAEYWHSTQQMWDYVQKPLRGDNHKEDCDEVKSFNNHQSIVCNIIEDARRYHLNHPGDGKILLIDAIMDLDLDEHVKTDDLTTMLFGSTHTTGYLMVWALYLVAENPEIQERAHTELNQVLGDNKLTPEPFNELIYLNQVIKETLRWATIAPFSVRYKDTDAEIEGYLIPAKTPIVHALAVLHHDPIYFPEPEKFDPDRFSPENKKKWPVLTFEPFGFAGKRKCPGHNFAILETAIVLAEIIKAFKISLVDGQTVTRVAGLVTEPANDILVTIVKRH